MSYGTQAMHRRVSACWAKENLSVIGLLASCKSVRNVFHDLVEASNATWRYLLTYKLSQDHLEMFFSAVRARGGSNNPNARQFKAAYQGLLVRHQVKRGNGNYLLRDNTNMLEATCAAVNIARRMDVTPVELQISEREVDH